MQGLSLEIKPFALEEIPWRLHPPSMLQVGEAHWPIPGSPPQTTPTWTPIAASNTPTYDVPAGLTTDTYYRRSVTDGSSTKISNAVVVTIGSAPTFTVTSTLTNVLCSGGITGAIDLSLTNAVAPITFSWNTGATTEDLNRSCCRRNLYGDHHGWHGLFRDPELSRSHKGQRCRFNLIQSNLSCLWLREMARWLHSVSGGQSPDTPMHGRPAEPTPIKSNLAAGTYTS